jgi:hypothetical protein
VANTCKLIDVFSSLVMMNHKNPLEVPLGEFNLRNRNKSHLFLEGKCKSPGCFSDLVKEVFSPLYGTYSGKTIKMPPNKIQVPSLTFCSYYRVGQNKVSFELGDFEKGKRS